MRINKLIRSTILTLGIGIFISCNTQGSFLKLSSSIYKNRIAKTKVYTKNEKKAKEARNEAYNIGKLNFFNHNEDLFIIDGYDIESDITYTQIWNTKGEINFKYDKKSYEFIQESFYHKKLKRLVSGWDLNRIEELSKKNSRWRLVYCNKQDSLSG